MKIKYRIVCYEEPYSIDNLEDGKFEYTEYMTRCPDRWEPQIIYKEYNNKDEALKDLSMKSSYINEWRQGTHYLVCEYVLEEIKIPKNPKGEITITPIAVAELAPRF